MKREKSSVDSNRHHDEERKETTMFELEKFAISFSYFNRCINFDSEYLFHYTGESIVPLINKDKYYSFRMTSADDFDDKEEGKIVDKIYSKVLCQLRDDGTIDEKIYSQLAGVKTLDTIINKNNFGCFDKLSKYENYVLCLTPNGNSEYMFKHYNCGQKGANISINTYLLNSAFFKVENCSISLNRPCFDYSIYKVVYSENEQISILSQGLKEILFPYLKLKDKTEDFNKILSYYASKLLMDLSLVFKDWDYHKEEEIRIVFRLSKDNDDYDKTVKINQQNKKRFVVLRIDKADEPVITKNPY